MKIKQHIITTVVLVLLTATVFLCLLNFSDNAKSQFSDIAQVNYNTNSGYAPASVEVINKLSQRLSSKSMSFTSEAETVRIKDTDVLPVYTTHSLIDLYESKLIGDGFTEDDVSTGAKKIIISDTLALKLYFNTDVVGKEFIINDERFIVSGVYENSRKLINNLAKDGKERVYIPYTCADSPETLPIHTITYDIKSSSAPIIEQMNLPQYHFTDFSEKSKVLETFDHIAFFVIFLGLSIPVLCLWFFLCKRIFTNIKKDYKKNYLFDSLTFIPHKYIMLSAVGVGIPLLLLFIYLNSDFSVYIVAKYIPNDNLFDIKHYINAIVDNAHIMNNSRLMGNIYLLNLYTKTFNIVLWLLILFVVISLITLMYLLSVEDKLINRHIEQQI